MITNLQVPTEPRGAEAAKQALRLSGFHVFLQCIKRLEASFFAGHRKSYLLVYILTVCLSSRLGDVIRSVCVCV